MSASRPGRSTATTVTACISPSAPFRRDTATRGRPSASTEATRASSALVTGAGPGGGPPRSAVRARVTRSSTSRARHGDQAAGPAATASASVRARSRSSTSDACRRPRRRSASTVAGRRGRAGGELDEREVLADQALDDLGVRPGQPHPAARPEGQRRADPGVVARARQLADVVQQGGEEQQVRPGRRRGGTAGATTAVSTRCRSTVCRWMALRCGRLRTPCHSGIHRTTRPARSSASQTPISAGPPPSRSTSASRAAGGHGVGQRRARSARCSTVTGESGSPARTAVDAARSGSTGSSPGGRRAPRTTSPSCSTRSVPERAQARTPGAAGAPATGTACRARRTVVSTACATVRAAAETRARSSSASPTPEATATASCSASSRRSMGRPVTACRASRTSSSTLVRRRRPRRAAGRRPRWRRARAASVASRSPPRLSLRSGSSR